MVCDDGRVVSVWMWNEFIDQYWNIGGRVKSTSCEWMTDIDIFGYKVRCFLMNEDIFCECGPKETISIIRDKTEHKFSNSMIYQGNRG